MNWNAVTAVAASIAAIASVMMPLYVLLPEISDVKSELGARIDRIERN